MNNQINPFQLIDERLDRLEKLMRELITINNSKDEIIGVREPLATRKQAAKYLGVNERTVIDIERSGRLKRIEIGKSIRYEWDDLTKFKKLNTK